MTMMSRGERPFAPTGGTVNARESKRPFAPTTSVRRAELAKIHIAKTQLNMDDDAYRALLQAVAGVKSSADLDARGRLRVIAQLRQLGADMGTAAMGAGERPFAPTRENEWVWVDTAAENRRGLLRKIIVLCRELGIRRGGQVRYVEGIARQMGGFNAAGRGAGNIDRPLPMCDSADLWRIAAALNYQLDRMRY
jgi:hypothetical protein